jgi:hypothetical protein
VGKKTERTVEKRIYISATSNRHLDDRRRRLKTAILEKIRGAGYEPQEFWESGIPENLAWSFESVDRVMRRCVGAVVFGFPRWTISSEMSEVRMVGEYNHYEGAVAFTHGLPILLLAEVGVDGRGVVWTGGGKVITFLPADADEGWLDDVEFSKRFNAWLRELDARKDVFLGYCSKNAGTAAQVQLLLEKHGATVLNWAMDFRAGGSILGEIENARAACSCGIFLFSEDDPLEGTAGGAAPRDNVVFEAGYFLSSKGSHKCLIIRQGEAKMPADVGGSIYVHLSKGAEVSAIEGRLADFLERNL